MARAIDLRCSNKERVSMSKLNQSVRVPMGTFQVESGWIRVSDPCYCPTPREGRGTVSPGRGVLLEPALNGKWHLMACMVDDQGWGRRVAELLAFHESQLEFLANRGPKAGKLYVDSGKVSVFDDAHFPRDPAQFEYDDESAFYKRVCDLTWSEDNGSLFGGCLANGGVTSSGVGDGCYPAYIYKDPTGLALAVTVDFLMISDDEEDDDDWDDDDEDEDDDWDEEDDDLDDDEDPDEEDDA